MPAMIEQRTKRLLEDVNGILFETKLGYQSLYVNQPLTDNFLDKLREIVGDQIDKQNLLSKLRSVLSVPHNKPWKFLDRDSLKLQSGRFSNVINSLSRIYYSEYFDFYQICAREVIGIRGFSSHGKKLGFDTAVTLCSGIPYIARGAFIKEVKPVWPELDSNLSAILRPNDKISSVFLKTAVGTMLGVFEDVYAVEDDYYVAQCMAGVGNIEVFMPMDEYTARSQPHLRRLTLPSSLSRTNGNIIFNSGSQEVLNKILRQ